MKTSIAASVPSPKGLGLATAAAVLLLAAPARAIELSLEENRAERGSVGFVDMQRLFSASPDAQRAKEGFEDLIRQAEERVNQRKAELVRLRQDLDAARAERDALAVSTEAAAAPAPSPAPAPAPAAASAPAAVPAPSTAAAASPPPAVAASTAPAAPRALALPGMAPVATEPAAPPAAAAPKALATPAPAAVSSAAAPAAPKAPAGPTLAQRLLELDGRIISLQAAISVKEREVAAEREDADKGLLDVEGRKTDQVLARLYRAISAVAHQEGVSVIVDRSTILYGHPAMDLTDKVLLYLRGHQQP